MADGHFNVCKECARKRARDNKHIPRVCKGCGAKFMANANEVKRRPGGGTYCSKECWLNHQRDRLKEIWDKKGRTLSSVYTLAHKHMSDEFGKANHCEVCGSTGGALYHWANLSGLYKLDRSDWKQMCPKCHKRYDTEQYKKKGKHAKETLAESLGKQ